MCTDTHPHTQRALKREGRPTYCTVLYPTVPCAAVWALSKKGACQRALARRAAAGQGWAGQGRAGRALLTQCAADADADADAATSPFPPHPTRRRDRGTVALQKERGTRVTPRSSKISWHPPRATRETFKYLTCPFYFSFFLFFFFFFFFVAVAVAVGLEGKGLTAWARSHSTRSHAQQSAPLPSRVVSLFPALERNCD